ncbi:MAG: purine-nucleoside phosphorylase [Bacteroidota bacterium]
MDNLTYAHMREAAQYIQSKHAAAPQFGIILGTGLGSLVNDMEVETTISYEDIPHFPVSTVETHSGKLVFGKLGGKAVVVMQGRFHYYEGYSMQQVTFPVRVMKLLGIEKLFISNAAGGMNPNFEKSDLMIIQDHINLMPESPLRGKNIDELGSRFPDMSEPYNRVLITQALAIAQKHQIPCHQGVYVGVQGPNLETYAEYRWLRQMGADAVGMSTIPENLVAVHMGLPVFAVSVITDLAHPDHLEPVSIESVIAAAMAAEPRMKQLLTELIAAQ